MIISGHRRFNTCKVIGLTDIPAEIREYSDLLVLESEIKLSEFLREMEKADGSEYEGMRGLPLTRDRFSELRPVVI